MRDHPIIEQMERTGYPLELISEEEQCKVDFYGDEILEDAEIVEDLVAGEIILKKNLNKYLEQFCNFQFKKAM